MKLNSSRNKLHSTTKGGVKRRPAPGQHKTTQPRPVHDTASLSITTTTTAALTSSNVKTATSTPSVQNTAPHGPTSHHIKQPPCVEPAVMTTKRSFAMKRPKRQGQQQQHQHQDLFDHLGSFGGYDDFQVFGSMVGDHKRKGKVVRNASEQQQRQQQQQQHRKAQQHRNQQEDLEAIFNSLNSSGDPRYSMTGYDNTSFRRAQQNDPFSVFGKSSRKQSGKKSPPRRSYFGSDDEFMDRVVHDEYSFVNVKDSGDKPRGDKKSGKKKKRRDIGSDDDDDDEFFSDLDFDTFHFGPDGSRGGQGGPQNLHDIFMMMGDSNFGEAEYMFADLQHDREEKRAMQKIERKLKSKRLARGPDGVEVFNTNDIEHLTQHVDHRHSQQVGNSQPSPSSQSSPGETHAAPTMEEIKFKKAQVYEAHIVREDEEQRIIIQQQQQQQQQRRAMMKDNSATTLAMDRGYDAVADDYEKNPYKSPQEQQQDAEKARQLYAEQQQLLTTLRQFYDFNAELMDPVRKEQMQHQIFMLEQLLVESIPKKTVSTPQTKRQGDRTMSYAERIRQNQILQQEQQKTAMDSSSSSSSTTASAMPSSDLLNSFLQDAEDQADRHRKHAQEENKLRKVSKDDIKNISFGPLGISTSSTPEQFVNALYAAADQRMDAKHRAYQMGIRGEALINVGKPELGEIELDEGVEKKLQQTNTAYANMRSVVTKLHDKIQKEQQQLQQQQQQQQQHTQEPVMNIHKMMRDVRKEIAIDKASSPQERTVIKDFSNVSRGAYEINTQLENNNRHGGSTLHQDQELMYLMDTNNIKSYDDIIKFVDYATSIGLPVQQIQNTVATQREVVEEKLKMAKTKKLKMQQEQKQQQEQQQRANNNPNPYQQAQTDAAQLEMRKKEEQQHKQWVLEQEALQEKERQELTKLLHRDLESAAKQSDKHQQNDKKKMKQQQKGPTPSAYDPVTMFRDDHFQKNLARMRSQHNGQQRKQEKRRIEKSFDQLLEDGDDALDSDLGAEMGMSGHHLFRTDHGDRDPHRHHVLNTIPHDIELNDSSRQSRTVRRDAREDSRRLHNLYHPPNRPFSTSTLRGPLRQQQVARFSSSSRSTKPGKLEEIIGSSPPTGRGGGEDNIKLNSLLASPSHREKQLSGENLVPKASRKQQQFTRQRNQAQERHDEALNQNTKYNFQQLANQAHTTNYLTMMNKKIQDVDTAVLSKHQKQDDMASHHVGIPEKQGKKGQRIAKLKAQGKYKEKYVPKLKNLDHATARAIYESTHQVMYNHKGNKVVVKKNLTAEQKARSVQQRLGQNVHNFVHALRGHYPTTLEEATAISPHARKGQTPAWRLDMWNDPLGLNNHGGRTSAGIPLRRSDLRELGILAPQEDDDDGGINPLAMLKGAQHGEGNNNNNNNNNDDGDVAHDINHLDDDLEAVPDFPNDPHKLIVEGQIDMIPEDDALKFENLYAKLLLREKIEQELRDDPEMCEQLLQKYNQRFGLGEFAHKKTKKHKNIAPSNLNSDGDVDSDGDSNGDSNGDQENDEKQDKSSQIYDLTMDLESSPTKKNGGDGDGDDDDDYDDAADLKELERAMGMLMDKSRRVGIATTLSDPHGDDQPSEDDGFSEEGHNQLSDVQKTFLQTIRPDASEGQRFAPLTKAELTTILLDGRYKIALQQHTMTTERKGHRSTPQEQREQFEEFLKQSRIQAKIDKGLGFITELEEGDLVDGGGGGDDELQHKMSSNQRVGDRALPKKRNNDQAVVVGGEEGHEDHISGDDYTGDSDDGDGEDDVKDSNNLYLPRRYMKLHKQGVYNQKSARRKTKEQLLEQRAHQDEWGRDTDQFYSRKEVLAMRGSWVEDDEEDVEREKRLQRYIQKNQRNLTQNVTLIRAPGEVTEAEIGQMLSSPSAQQQQQQHLDDSGNDDNDRSHRGGDPKDSPQFDKMLRGIRELDEQQLLDHLVDDDDDNDHDHNNHDDNLGLIGNGHHDGDDNDNNIHTKNGEVFIRHKTLKNSKKHREREIIDITELTRLQKRELRGNDDFEGGDAFDEFGDHYDDGDDGDDFSNVEMDEFHNTDEEEYVKGHEYSAQNLSEKPRQVGKVVGGDPVYSFELQEDDLLERFIRGSGPGGQSVNKTKNCVLLQHTPTGTIVKCAQTRELPTNRHIARKIMKRKLEALFQGKDSYLGRKIERIQRKKERSKRKHKISTDSKSLKRDEEILKLKQKLGLVNDALPSTTPNTLDTNNAPSSTVQKM